MQVVANTSGAGSGGRGMLNDTVMEARVRWDAKQLD
jgi:hypothetical protein